MIWPFVRLNAWLDKVDCPQFPIATLIKIEGNEK